MKQACSGVFAVLVLAAVRSADAVTSSLMDVCATEIIACTTESEICQTCAVSLTQLDLETINVENTGSDTSCDATLSSVCNYLEENVDCTLTDVYVQDLISCIALEQFGCQLESCETELTATIQSVAPTSSPTSAPTTVDGSRSLLTLAPAPETSAASLGSRGDWVMGICAVAAGLFGLVL